MAGASIKDTLLALDWIPCIYYPACFKNNKIQALINSSSEVNAMTLTYTAKLDLKVWHINVKTQKIEGFTLEIFGMVLAIFQIEDKQDWIQYFQKTFLLANTNIEMVPEMLFLTLSNANVSFLEWELIWKSYTATEALPITK